MSTNSTDLQIPDDIRNCSIETNMGTITFELYWSDAPNTCLNFYTLINRGYYDNNIFHRIVKDFCIQTGDPTGTGRGGTSIYGKKFDDEITNKLKHVGAGILSMANSGPNTNGSQFFITLAPATFLDGKHTIFGRVKDGMSVVQKISLVETKNEKPIHPIKIFSSAICN